VRNEGVEEFIRVRGVKATQSRRLKLQKRAQREGWRAKKAENRRKWGSNQQKKP